MQPNHNAEVLDLIGPIYDTVIDPALWPEVLERIRTRLHFHNAILAAYAMPGGETVTQAVIGVPAQYIPIYRQYERHVIDVWGGAARVARVPLEEPVVQSALAFDVDYQDNPYYVHFVRAQGINDAVAVKLADDRLTMAALAFGRHESAHPVTEAELAGLRLLTPHMRRAVTISRLLDVAVNAAVTFEAALEASQRAIVIVEEDLRIAFANEAARKMLKAQTPIAEVDHRLVVAHELVPGQLQAAASAAASREAELGHRGLALPITGADGTPLVVHVMPLRERRVRTDFGRRAVAAVFLSEPGSPVALPTDALAIIYGLTPAESRVLELVADGGSTRGIADVLGVATSTIRSQLIAVYQKTGRHSRVELMRMFKEVLPPA